MLHDTVNYLHFIYQPGTLIFDLPPNHLLLLCIHFKFRFIFNCYPCFFSCGSPFQPLPFEHLNEPVGTNEAFNQSLNQSISTCIRTPSSISDHVRFTTCVK